MEFRNWIRKIVKGQFRGWDLVDDDGQVLEEVSSRNPHMTPDGYEAPSKESLAMPAKFQRPETLEQQMRRMIEGYRPEDSETETFDEANDFDIDDDIPDPNTPYETVFDPVLNRDISAQEFLNNRDAYRTMYEEVFSDAEVESGEPQESLDPKGSAKQEPEATPDEQNGS